MKSVMSSTYLVVDIDNRILDLIYILNLCMDVKPHHDHLYLSTDRQGGLEKVFSHGSKTANDVRIPVEVFSEILIDIASGMKVKQAFERQGYTYIDEY